MTLLTNSAEGGTSGTAVTTANSGGASGTAWNTVNLTTTLFQASAAYHGSLGYQIANPGTTTPYVRWDFTNTDTSAYRFYFRQSAVTTATTEILGFRNAASATAAQLVLNTTNRLQLQIAGPGTPWSATAALSANTWYRIEVALDRTARTYRVAYYLGDSTTAEQDTGVTSSGATAWTNQFGQARFGKSTTNSFAGSWDFDDMAVDTTAAAFIGPAVTATAYRASQFLPFF